MFCENCGVQVSDQTKYCPNCGTALQQPNISRPNIPPPQVIQPETNQNKGYASMSFVFAIIGIFLCCIAPLFGVPAVILGGVSLNKKEPESGKAYAGIIIGGIEVVLYLLMLIAGGSEG